MTEQHSTTPLEIEDIVPEITPVRKTSIERRLGYAAKRAEWEEVRRMMLERAKDRVTESGLTGLKHTSTLAGLRVEA